MNNYTGYGWEGKKYNKELGLTDITKIIRKKLKTEFPEIKFSVTGERASLCWSIHVSIMRAPFNFINGNKKYVQVNHYYIDDSENITEKAKPILKKIVKIVQSYNYNDSDSQIDYFDTNFYFHLDIGKWDKPFRVVQPV